jgi:hypothetical protein
VHPRLNRTALQPKRFLGTHRSPRLTTPGVTLLGPRGRRRCRVVAGDLDDRNEAERGPQPAEAASCSSSTSATYPPGHHRVMTGPAELAGALGQPWAAHGRTGSGPALAAVPRGHRATAATQGCRPVPDHRSGGEPAGASSLWNLSAPRRAKRRRLARRIDATVAAVMAVHRCLGCWRSTAFGGPSSTAAGSGRSPASSGSREGAARS